MTYSMVDWIPRSYARGDRNSGRVSAASSDIGWPVQCTAIGPGVMVTRSTSGTVG